MSPLEEWELRWDRCPVFDHTCDDCMLPANWLDYDDDPAYIAAQAVY